MMTCKEVVEFLMGYLDGEIAPAERAAFEEHLKACPPCVAYLQSYEATVKLGREAHGTPCGHDHAGPSLPDSLVKAVLAARQRPPK
ncbi:MAG: anti-sigma factor family protein [Phycisphaerales bacterium]